MTPVLPSVLQPSALKLHPAKGFWHLHCSRHKTDYVIMPWLRGKRNPSGEGVGTKLFSVICPDLCYWLCLHDKTKKTSIKTHGFFFSCPTIQLESTLLKSFLHPEEKNPKQTKQKDFTCILLYWAFLWEIDEFKKTNKEITPPKLWNCILT